MSVLRGIRKKFKSRKQVVFKNDQHVYRDWILSISMFFGLVLLVVIFGTYMFISAENIEISENEEIQDSSRNIINQELLIETIEFYTDKEKTFQELQTNFKGAPNI